MLGNALRLLPVYRSGPKWHKERMLDEPVRSEC